MPCPSIFLSSVESQNLSHMTWPNKLPQCSDSLKFQELWQLWGCDPDTGTSQPVMVAGLTFDICPVTPGVETSAHVSLHFWPFLCPIFLLHRKRLWLVNRAKSSILIGWLCFRPRRPAMAQFSALEVSAPSKVRNVRVMMMMMMMRWAVSWLW